MPPGGIKGGHPRWHVLFLNHYCNIDARIIPTIPPAAPAHPPRITFSQRLQTARQAWVSRSRPPFQPFLQGAPKVPHHIELLALAYVGHKNLWQISIVIFIVFFGDLCRNFLYISPYFHSIFWWFMAIMTSFSLYIFRLFFYYVNISYISYMVIYQIAIWCC